LVESYQNKLRLDVYLKNEIQLILKAAGFLQVKIFAGLSEVEPIPYKDYYLMVLANF